MQAVMEKTRATEDVRHFIDTHPYASEYFIDADALHADGATVEAFKTYLDRKLLNARVDRFEDDIHLFMAFRPRMLNSQEKVWVGMLLIWNISHGSDATSAVLFPTNQVLAWKTYSIHWMNGMLKAGTTSRTSMISSRKTRR